MARPETHTADMKIEQRARVVLPDTGSIEHEDEILVGSETLHSDYLESLAFAEEPVMIRIEPSAEKFAPKVVDCWVNGKGAEQHINGKWVTLGWLPVGQVVVTRRKYVEVLARSKTDSVQTNVSEEDSENPVNAIDRFTSQRNPFSVLQDNNPKGHEWLVGIMRLAG